MTQRMHEGCLRERALFRTCMHIFVCDSACAPSKVCLLVCADLCALCVIIPEGSFKKHTVSDIGWQLYNLTGLCTEASCGMSH